MRHRRSFTGHHSDGLVLALGAVYFIICLLLVLAWTAGSIIFVIFILRLCGVHI